jgi:hypothetical protein
MQKAKTRTPLSKVALVLAFSLWMPSANSQASTVFGSPDCGQWVAEKTPTRRTWLMGYLSGLNNLHDLLNQKPKNPLDALSSADQAFLWMDNWCKANPLKSVSNGAIDLFIELMRNKK